MKHAPIPPRLFIDNRDRVARRLLPNSLAVVQANDLLPVNADATLLMCPNSDLFYLSGIEQEETVLLLAPEAFDPQHREILFLRQPNDHLRTWEGHKLDQDQAAKLSGVRTIKWLSEFRNVFHQLMGEVEHVYLNSNEHRRAVIEVETRDARFARDCQARYSLHDYRRLARILHELRVVKSSEEIGLIRKACQITRAGFLRALKVLRPGINEADLEAELAREFIRRRARFAYPPILASGSSSCVLHYAQNDRPCRKGELLLMDVGASYANYNADLTRTLPVNGRFTRRQRQVYLAVLRVLRAMIRAAVPGKRHRDWQKEAETLMQEELLRLKLLKPGEIRRQDPDKPALKRYFMHGLGHPLGLDVHDVGFLDRPFAPGWVLTVEPGIYIPEEGFGIRLENDILVTDHEPIDLMADIPIEPDEIEELMHRPARR